MALNGCISGCCASSRCVAILRPKSTSSSAMPSPPLNCNSLQAFKNARILLVAVLAHWEKWHLWRFVVAALHLSGEKTKHADLEIAAEKTELIAVFRNLHHTASCHALKSGKGLSTDRDAACCRLPSCKLEKICLQFQLKTDDPIWKHIICGVPVIQDTSTTSISRPHLLHLPTKCLPLVSIEITVL